MYNGIGLPTARGSGTNGLVTRNLSALRSRPSNVSQPSASQPMRPEFTHRAPNPEILLHEKKRQVELKCLQLREMLLQKGSMDKSEVERQVNDLRQELLAKLDQ